MPIIPNLLARPVQKMSKLYLTLIMHTMLQQNFSYNSLSCNKDFLACCTNTESIIMRWKESVQNRSLLKPTANLELLVNQLNNATTENNYDPEKISSSKFCVIEAVYIEIPDKNKYLSQFHINKYLSVLYKCMQ